MTEFQRAFNAVLQSIEQMIHYATVSFAQRFYAIKKKKGEKEKTSKVHFESFDGGQGYDHQKCYNMFVLQFLLICQMQI